MTGEDGRQVFAAVLPQQDIERLCAQCGVIARPRQLHLGRLVRAMVLAAGTPGGAYQADSLRSDLEVEVPRVARSAVYRWLDEPLEPFMTALADRALAYARAQQVDLAGLLGGVKDWSLVDATTVTVRDAWRDAFPGTGDSAALKVHTVLSVGGGAPVHDHLGPAREPDSRHLQIDESWQGDGLLADLASASWARLRACNTHGVRLVMHLNDHWKPQVDAIARGRVTQAFCPGTDLDGWLDQEIRRLDGQAIDADGRVGSPKDALHLRRVGVPTPQGYGFCLPHLPPRIGPRQVADLYRVRWEVERSLKLDQSVHRLDQMDAERPGSVKTLWQASLIAAMMTALLAHTHHARLRPPREGRPRTEAPLHPRRIALQLAASGQAIAQALDLKGAAAKRRWQPIAALLMPSGKDPHGRRRPSVWDQLRGWKRQPVARKRANRNDRQAAA
jgi:putative transposase